MNLSFKITNDMYYYLKWTSDRDIVGEYPQMLAYTDDNIYDKLQNELRNFKKYSYQKMDIDRINIPILIGEDSFLTDLLSSGFIPNESAILTKKTMGLINQFNTLDTQSINVKILHRNEIYDNYKILHFTESLLPKINYDKSEFYNSIQKEPIIIKDYEDFIAIRNELIKNYEQPFSKNLFIEKKHVESLDYFTLGFPSGEIIVSERLKEALEEAKITGIRFQKIDDILFEGKNEQQSPV